MTRSNCVMRKAGVPAALALGLCAASAHAGVELTLKLMDFDVTQPARETYRDSELGDRPINQAVEQAWVGVAGNGPVIDGIKDWLSKPDRMGEGMTARDIVVRLGSPGEIQLVSTGQAKGRATIRVTGNEIDLTTTHPKSRGAWMDPRVRVKFDLTLTMDLFIEPTRPRLRAIQAVGQPGNVSLYALNQSATIGGTIDQLLSSFGGTPSITDKVRAAMEPSKLPFTRAFNDELDRKAPTLVLPGYAYNGGRIENGRVLIAQYKRAANASARVAVVASWPKSMGELMGDCRPVGIGASWQAGPRPFAGVHEPPRQAAKVLNVNPRTVRRDEYICSTVLEVAKAAPLQIAWAQPVPINVGSPNPMAMRQVLAGQPAGWTNPVVPTEIEYVLALSKQTRPGHGVQSDAVTAARRNPLDPVARERRIDQVSQPAVRQLPSTTVTSSAKSLETTRVQSNAATSTLSRQQAPQRTAVPESALSR